MKKPVQDALIVALWPIWLEKNPMAKPNGTHAMGFYQLLNKELTSLVRFDVPGDPDPWQVFHGILLDKHLVSD